MRNGTYTPAPSLSQKEQHSGIDHVNGPRLEPILRRIKASRRVPAKPEPGSSEIRFNAAPYFSGQERGDSAPVFASAVADLDGTNAADVITAQVNGRLNVLINDGKGRLLLRHSNDSAVSAGATVVLLDTADLNGDGRPDVIAMDAWNSALLVYLNQGDGIFGNPATLSVAPSSGAGFQNGGGFAIGDVNGDGKLDLVAVSNLQTGDFSSAQTVFSEQTFIGNGDGTFQQAKETNSTLDGFQFLQFGTAVKLTDMNHDGKADLVTEIRERGFGGESIRIVVAPGAGDGSFQPIGTNGMLFEGQGNPQSTLQVEDIDSDGNPDALFISGEGTIRVANGKPDGTLAEQKPLLSNIFGAYLLQFGRFNRDRNLDLLVYGWGNAAVFSGDGRGNFASPKAQYSGGIGGDQQPIPSDFNGDGKLDFAWVDSSFNKVSIYAGNADGTFDAAKVITPSNRSKEYPNNTEWGTNIGALGAGDFNGDGRRDVFVYDNTVPGFGENNFGLNDGRGGFKFTSAITSAQAEKITSEHFWFQVSPNFGDFNGDGRDDVILNVDHGLLLSITTQKGTTLDAVQIELPIPDHCVFLSFPQVADINADGHLDMVTAVMGNPDCGNSMSGVLISLGNGEGQFQTKYMPFGNRVNNVGLADMNNDGKIDLLTGDANSDDTLKLSVLPGLGNGEFDASNPHEVAGNRLSLAFVVGDYNADGNKDVAVMSGGELGPDGNIQPETAGVLLVPGNGDFSVGDNMLLVPGVFPYAAEITDVNRDGHPDVVATEVNSFDPAEPIFGLMVIPNSGDGSFGKAISHIVPKWNGFPLSYLATADFNQDGWPDAMVGGNGSSVVFLNTTGSR